MSKRLVPALLVCLLALTTFAKERAVAARKQDDARLAIGSGASVTGQVTAVSGNLITLADGLVTIDATNARILHGDGAATIAAIQRGALIIATLRNADVTFTGTTQSVDVAGNQFLLLNRTIKVDAHTAFVNFGDHPSIAGLQPNTMVIVEANVVSGALVASRITLIAPIPPRPEISSGVVK